MRIFALDANCMIAAVCTWHEHHQAASAEIHARLNRGEKVVVPAPALVEAYAVLTRLPPPHRLSPADAWSVLDVNFARPASVVALGAATYTDVLRRAMNESVAGGRTYDVVIAACALQGRAQAILTFNRRHFEPPPEGLTIVVPPTNPDASLKGTTTR